MTQEDKQLFLKDLCGRLLYKVKISVTEPERTEFTNQFSYENGRTLVGVLYAIFPDEERIIVDELDKSIAPHDVRCGGFNIEKYKIKPYLRPMSSMTTEECKEYDSLCGWVYDEYNAYRLKTSESYDWLNAHHFDYRGLIPMGLALEASEEMYRINKSDKKT